MFLYTKLLLLVIFTSHGVTTTPLQEALVSGLQLIKQVVQADEDSSMFSFIRHLQERLSPQPKLPKGEEDDEALSGVWATLSKSLGLQTARIPAIAVNLLIFLSQMVTHSLTLNDGNNQRRFSKEQSFLEIILEQPKVSRLLSTMKDPELMKYALREVADRLQGGSSDCVVQLLCRTTPVVRGMQTSLSYFLKEQPRLRSNRKPRGDTKSDKENLVHLEDDIHDLTGMTSTWNNLSAAERLFFFLPSYEDFIKAGKLCKIKYPMCFS